MDSDPGAKILLTSDGGYIGAGIRGNANKSAVYKFSHEGILEWTHFYSQDQMQVIYAESVKELSDGYLIIGIFQQNFDINTFLLKLDKNGNFVWFKTDASIEGLNDFVSHSIKKENGNYLLNNNARFPSVPLTAL